MKGGTRVPGSMALEMFVLLSVISLIGIVAIPSYNSYRTNSSANCVANKFRTYAASFHHYADLHGEWPGEQIPGEIPEGMTGKLPDFQKATVIGGIWDWETSRDSTPAAICLLEPGGTEELILRIDQILDDGDLASGNLVYRGDRLILSLLK